jgi:superfamily II DNA or RNA helicase
MGKSRSQFACCGWLLRLWCGKVVKRTGLMRGASSFWAAMAGKRKLIYMVDWDAAGRVHCTFSGAAVLNWKAIKELSIRSVRDLLTQASGVELGAEDRKLVLRLIQHESREFTGALLSGQEGYELLQQMVATGRAFWQRGNQLRLKWGKRLAASAGWEVARNGVAQPVWQISEPVQALLALAPPCGVSNDGKLDVVHPLRCAWEADAACAWTGHGFADTDDVEAFVRRFVNRYPMITLPDRPGKSMVAGDPLRPVPILRLLRNSAMEGPVPMRQLKELLLARLEFRYGDRKVRWEEQREQIATRCDGVTLIVPRQSAFEQQCVQQLAALGLRPKGFSRQSMLDFHAYDFQLAKDSKADWGALLTERLPQLEAAGWELTQDPLLPVEGVQAGQILQQLELEESGWHSFAASIAYDGQRISVLPLLRDFLKRHRNLDNAALRELFQSSSFTVPTKDERWLVVPGKLLQPLVDALFELGLQRRLDSEGRLQVSRWRARELAALVPEADERAIGGSGLDLSALRQRLSEGGHPFTPSGDPRALFPQLRDYQCTGIGWIEFLEAVDAHGILADDMGLGKTFQVLAYHGMRRKAHADLPPVLVVCPTSVMGNWIQEVAKRAPWLKARLQHGPQRPRAAADIGGDADIVITNYPCLREDVAELALLDWDMVILDEAQAIKNAQSQTFAAACKLRARRRLCLTGTPLENHLRELWALVQFLMPNYLGNYEQFAAEFVRPIGMGNSSPTAVERSRLLANRLAPFVLRRSKSLVAPELPERTEINHSIDLAPVQAQRYEAVRASMIKDIRSLLESRTLAASQIHILDALTRLRLLCCDPRIGSHGDRGLTAADSAKFERLFELLEELMEEGSRVLVFSQFVQMLELIEAEVGRRGWGYRLLTGQTTDRREPVDAFQSGKVPLLLMSLKAAGTGLNLTAADAVILYDPWWNPAVEQQATDRAHRIGREAPVFIHRLIANGTVEEGMLALQERKRQLIEQVLDGLPGEAWALDADTLADVLGVPREHFAGG